MVKNLPANAGDLRDRDLNPGSGRSPGGRNATHFSILAWRIPQTEEPGRLQSMGLQRVGHDWASSLWGPSSQSYGFSSSHVWMWELDHKENWALKNWWFWTVVLEKTLESPLDCKEIQSVHPKGNKSWIFIGRDDAKAETPILWPPDEKNWLLGKGSVAEKDWRQEAKGRTEDEMVGWHHRLNGYEFEQAPGVSDGQGSLACWSPWSCQELATTERVNWTEKVIIICFPQSFPFWKILNEYNVMSQLSRGSHETNS